MNIETGLSKSLTIKIPNFNGGTFDCIVDTNEDFDLLFSILENRYSFCKKYILIDDSIFRKYNKLVEALKLQKGVLIIPIPSNERSKSFSKVSEIIEKILLTFPSKENIIINIGGGVVMNVGGFIAGLLLRGINFIHIPTTFSSQTDVFFGGKQAVNVLGFKNQVGFFKDPVLCYINTNFLRTIDKKEFKHQMIEGIKLCLTSDADLFWSVVNKIEKIDQQNQSEMSFFIEKFIKLKVPLVQKDPFELKVGLCNVYGHTLGHAIEMSSNERISHCEAVGIGMLLASKIAFQLDICKEETVNAHEILLEKLDIIKKIPNWISVGDIKSHLKHDKKLHRSNIPFVLLTEVGRVAQSNGGYYNIVPEELINKVISSHYD
jgi:3-dehydroquinate synthase